MNEQRVPITFHSVDGSEEFLDKTLSQIGVPPWDILCGRKGLEQRFYEMADDAPAVLGELSVLPGA